MKLIDKDALVAEIESAIKIIYAGREYVGIPYSEECIARGLQKAEDIINTLEVKEVDLQKEPASEDLEETANILKEKETMWMQEPNTGEFIPVSYPADAPLGYDMKGNLIYPDDIKVTLEVKDVDVEKEYKDFIKKSDNGRSMLETAKYFFELGLKAKQG